MEAGGDNMETKGPVSVTPRVVGSAGRKHRAAGEVGAPVQVSGSPSSLTNFEFDL